PLVLLNPFLVTSVNGRISDITLLRLPQLVPNALVWVAVLAPLASRLGRLAQSQRLELARRYALACSHRWLGLGRLGRAVPAHAKVAVYGVLVGVSLASVTTFLTADVVNGPVHTYLESADSALSVQSSRKATLDHEEGVYGFLRENAPIDAVVLADAMSSYYISGLVGNPVVAVPESHSPRRVEAVDGPERRADVRMTFRGRRTSPTTPEGALNVVLKYNASYVVTPANGLTVFDRRPKGEFRP
ncbi:unnamed protein product, partial [marine sediment metagenome]